MESTIVTTRSKKRLLKGLRGLCCSTGNKIHWFVSKHSKEGANVLDSTSNQYSSTLKQHSSISKEHLGTSQGHSRTSKEHSISSEKHSSYPDQYPRIPEQTSSTLEHSCTSELYSSASKISSIASDQYSKAPTQSTTDEPKIVDPRRPNLDTLPELVLLHLFTYLNAQDLCNLGWCAPNLRNVARRQKKFWHIVRHVCNGFSPCHRLLLPFLNDFTTVLHLSKSSNLSSSDIVKGRRDTCLDPNFFQSLKNLRGLKSLTLEDHSLEYRQMLNLKCLPKSLTKLRLRRIILFDLNGEQCLAFEDLHLYLPNLELVDVSHCSWMNSHTLCSLSQCSQLKELIMFGCSEFNYVMPYMVTATICGFWALEIPEQISNERACRRPNLLYNTLNFNEELQIFQHQPSSLATQIVPVDYTGSRRTVRLSEYFSTWLETLVARNYSEITDSTLREIEMCSPKLYDFVRCANKFWKNIHAVCSGCSLCHIRLLPFLSDLTTGLHLSKATPVSSPDCEDVHIEPYFLKRLKQLPNLKSFALENHSLRYKHLLNHLRYPPKLIDLTELRLKKINLLGLNGQPCLAFEDLHLHLPNLEVVDVSHCSWVTSDVLWSLSKCAHLKTLIMVGCNKINYIVPPYTRIDNFLGESSVDGFCELETLNLRLTNVTFEEIGIFKKLKNLKHIFLERPKENASKLSEQQERRKLIHDHYHRLESWWGVPTYIIEDFAIRACRVFRLSELLSSWLRTLVARNYIEITDLALRDIEDNLKSIQYLDITGTLCSTEGVASFQTRNPEMTIFHESIYNSESHNMLND